MQASTDLLAENMRKVHHVTRFCYSSSCSSATLILANISAHVARMLTAPLPFAPNPPAGALFFLQADMQADMKDQGMHVECTAARVLRTDMSKMIEVPVKSWPLHGV